MKWFEDLHNRQIRLTNERQGHIETDHPEMFGQIDKIQEMRHYGKRSKNLV